MLAFSCVLAVAAAQAEPYVPQRPDEVVTELPAAANPVAHRAQLLHKLLRRAPTQLDLAISAAEADLAAGRADSDPRFFGHAESALQPWWPLADPPPRVLLLRATIRQNRHDFAAARADLDRLIAADPNNAQAYLTRAVVHQVTGDFATALADCERLAAFGPSLAARTCVDGVRSLTGDGEPSLDDLARAIDELPTTDAAVKIWALTTLGEIGERLGKPDRAEAAYRRALAVGVPDGYLLGAYADFLLAQRRAGEVVDLLKDKTRSDPLLLRLALAEQARGSAARDAHVADLRERFRLAQQRGDVVHRREHARFALAFGPQAEALPLARSNWELQREPADAIGLLAAAAASDPAAAEPVLVWLDRTHLEDIRAAALVRRLRGGA